MRILFKRGIVIYNSQNEGYFFNYYIYFIMKYLEISVIYGIFAVKYSKMIHICHKNFEIESLVLKNESTLYKELLQKKAFLKALRAFYSILEVIDDIRDLMKYNFLQYTRKELSSVLITGGDTKKKLIFSEEEDGQSIVILELI